MPTTTAIGGTSIVHDLSQIVYPDVFKRYAGERVPVEQALTSTRGILEDLGDVTQGVRAAQILSHLEEMHLLQRSRQEYLVLLKV
jgi:hypothetical protein